MSVLVKLREYHTLSNSENEVRMYILRNSKKVISMSTQELAAKSYTSPATVIRLCKRLELKGYSELKIQLASEIKAFETMNLDVVDQTTFKKGDSLTELIDKVTDISIHSIEETRLLLDYEVLLCVARQIMDARSSLSIVWGLIRVTYARRLQKLASGTSTTTAFAMPSSASALI